MLLMLQAVAVFSLLVRVQVWVLLFGVGQRDTEGIYSLRAMSGDTGVLQDTIIAFEDAEDAERSAASQGCSNSVAVGVLSWQMHSMVVACCTPPPGCVAISGSAFHCAAQSVLNPQYMA